MSKMVDPKITGPSNTSFSDFGPNSTANNIISHSPTSRVAGFPAHPGRSAAIAEVHSRPPPLLGSPRVLVQLAFMTEGDITADTAAITDLCRRLGETPPDDTERHYVLRCGTGTLHWERHSEFSTYLWESPLVPWEHWKSNSPFNDGFAPPGPLMSGVRLELLQAGPETDLPDFDLDRESLCHTRVEDGNASILTDFRQDPDGLTRMYILDRGLSESRRGVLAQRLIEIETYRVFCMLGLTLAQSLSAQLRRMEDDLVKLTDAIRTTGPDDSDALLGRLTILAAELEAQAASSLFRFGASRAYYDIVMERLQALKEVPYEGADSWSQFLARRVAPAMRTCRSVQDRQENLSRKLARTTQLLRTWVDVEVEKQNRNLLASMNDRARLQLRLQQTVEGLSVAAISYYVVGLLSYMLSGLPALPVWLPPKALLAVSVPFVVLAIWLVIRRIKRKHTGDLDSNPTRRVNQRHQHD